MNISKAKAALAAGIVTALAAIAAAVAYLDEAATILEALQKVLQ